MKTYLTLWFSSEGESPLEVVDTLRKVGFVPVHGNYDLVYEWGEKASVDEILHLADIVRKSLEGKGVLFKLESL